MARRPPKPTRPDIFTDRGITPPWEKGGDVARRQEFYRYEGESWEERRAKIGARESLYEKDRHPDSGKAAELRARAWERATERLERGYGKQSGERVPPDPAARNWDLLLLEETLANDEWPTTRSGNAQVRQLVRKERRLREGRETRQVWRDWLRRALAVDGWLMPRHAVMPDADEPEFSAPVVAQLRPDLPVYMGDAFEWHHHLYRLTARDRPDHEAKICDLAPRRGQPGYPHPYAIPHKDGAFLPTGHLHPRRGEPVVPCRDDDGRYTWHSHLDQSKYLYTPGNTARRLGTNPLVLERGFGGPDDLFVMVMEGTLKMCSVVEAGYPAIDAGSVNLWHGGRQVLVDDDGFQYLDTILELSAFAERHLVGRPVAVVCDSDWHHNAAVWDQTQAVVGVLNAAGAYAVGCAPPEGRPLGWEHPTRRTRDDRPVEMRDKLGVDDWIGKSDPWLDENYGPPRRDLLDLVCQVPGGAATLSPDDPRLMGGGERGTQRRRREKTVRVLTLMGQMILPGSSVARFAQKDIAIELGLPPRTVGDAFDLAVERGLARRLDESVKHHVTGDVISSAPWCWITPEALPIHTEPTLGAWLVAERAPRPWWWSYS
jgi:hypothetical protein